MGDLNILFMTPNVEKLSLSFPLIPHRTGVSSKKITLDFALITHLKSISIDKGRFSFQNSSHVCLQEIRCTPRHLDMMSELIDDHSNASVNTQKGGYDIKYQY